MRRRRKPKRSRKKPKLRSMTLKEYSGYSQQVTVKARIYNPNTRKAFYMQKTFYFVEDGSDLRKRVMKWLYSHQFTPGMVRSIRVYK